MPYYNEIKRVYIYIYIYLFIYLFICEFIYLNFGFKNTDYYHLVYERENGRNADNMQCARIRNQTQPQFNIITFI